MRPCLSCLTCLANMINQDKEAFQIDLKEGDMVTVFERDDEKVPHTKGGTWVDVSTHRNSPTL